MSEFKVTINGKEYVGYVPHGLSYSERVAYREGFKAGITVKNITKDEK